MLYVLNFGHPLKPEVLERLAPCQEVQVPFHFRLGLHERLHPKRQIEQIVDEAALLMEKNGAKLNGTVPLVVVLPGISEGSALLLAELHGRLGNFPRILAIRRLSDGTYGLYKNSASDAVLHLEQLRNSARMRRVA